ncbi:MAG: hypothetical protein DCF20_07155 [Pseudanabaena sp.]|nr:MAG: hypothetical protein DCF20_07155 [Pseudanabaena sp.]
MNQRIKPMPLQTYYRRQSAKHKRNFGFRLKKYGIETAFEWGKDKRHLKNLYFIVAGIRKENIFPYSINSKITQLHNLRYYGKT